MEDIHEKSDIRVERLEHVELAAEDLPLPPELAGLGGEELRQLERQVVRRLDCFLLPAVVLLFLLNILDRNNIANAKIVGLTDTLNINDTQYNTCLMIFYVGYVMTQLPSNIFIAKIKPSIYIGCVTSAWGVVRKTFQWFCPF